MQRISLISALACFAAPNVSACASLSATINEHDFGEEIRTVLLAFLLLAVGMVLGTVLILRRLGIFPISLGSLPCRCCEHRERGQSASPSPRPADGGSEP